MPKYYLGTELSLQTANCTDVIIAKEGAALNYFLTSDFIFFNISLMEDIAEKLKNGYYIVRQNRTGKLIFVEYFEEDWYFPDKVRNMKCMKKYYSIQELLFEKRKTVRDSDLQTVPKIKEKEDGEIKSNPPRRRGRTKTDASTLEGRAKYLTEYKTTF